MISSVCACAFKSRRLLHGNFSFVPFFFFILVLLSEYRVAMLFPFCQFHISAHTIAYIESLKTGNVKIDIVKRRTTTKPVSVKTMCERTRIAHRVSDWNREKNTLENRRKRAINFVLKKHPFFMFERDNIDWKMIYLDASDIFIGLFGYTNVFGFKSMIKITWKVYIGCVVNIELALSTSFFISHYFLRFIYWMYTTFCYYCRQLYSNVTVLLHGCDNLITMHTCIREIQCQKNGF